MLWTTVVLILIGIGIALSSSWSILWWSKVSVEEDRIKLLARLQERREASSQVADYLRPHLLHEAKAFRRLTDARAAVEHPGIAGLRGRAIAEMELYLATHELMQRVMLYPKLLSDQTFVALYRLFYQAHDEVGSSLGNYNTAVARYNATVRWHGLVAKLMRLKPRELFSAPVQS